MRAEQQPPERTTDGHHVVIDGRRWRATDPSLPDDTAARLRRHLMAARRAVRTALAAGDSEAERAARSRVQVAKTALGERGTPWWEQSPQERRDRWERGLGRLDAGSQLPAKDQQNVDQLVERAILDLLERRKPTSSICPSDAARAAYAGEGDGWRALMEPTRRAAWRLAAAGEVEVTQAGRPVASGEVRGPIRIRRAE